MKKMTIWLVCIYILLCVGFYLAQGLFFFHPKKLAADHVFPFKQPFLELTLKMDRETVYDVIQFKTTGPPKGVVLYFHGNKENIGHYQMYSADFTDRGYECWMIDYPGFGKSTGLLTEESLKQQAQYFYKLARAKFAKDSIVIYGKSLGTGIAAYLASKVESKLLVLEAPYYNMESLALHFVPILPVRWLLKVNLMTNEYVSICNEPIVIFHGTNDGLIPFSNARRLEECLKKADRFVPIEGGTHNDLPSNKQYHAVLDSLLSMKKEQ